jgi:CheY-like chemotaxis protein
MVPALSPCSDQPDAAFGGRVSGANTKRVLIVDDDPEIRDVVAAMLESIGFSVWTADGASVAIALIETEAPDAILTDIHMAEGDGFELMNAVRDRGLSIPIVAMSGGSSTLSGTDHLELARKLGAAAIVDKPFRKAHLAEAIDRAIAGRGAPSRKS